MAFIDDLFSNGTTDTQSMLLAALDQLAEGVIVANVDGELIYVNSSAAAIHGVATLHVSPEEYAETYHLLTVDGEPYPSSQLPLSRTVVEGATVEDARWRIRRPDGRIIDAVGTSRPVFDSNNRQIASVLTLADKTDELEAQQSLAEALEVKDSLLFEVNHRVKNNLAMVSSLLHLQGKSCTDSQARDAFRDVSARVNVLVDIHRRLYAVGQHSAIEAVEFLSTMTMDTVRALGSNPRVEVEVKQRGKILLSIDKCTTLALALNELTLNSLKHAFKDVDAPLVSVDIDASDSALTIIYRDNGPGLSENTDGDRGGIGRALVSQLTTSLGAELVQRSSEPGFYTKIVIPFDGNAAVSVIQ